MNNRIPIDRGILVPIGIGILSMAGIGLLSLIVYFDGQETAPIAVPTSTPFKYLFLGTETYTPEPEIETATPVGSAAEEPFSINSPTASDVAATQNGTSAPETSVTPLETNTPAIDQTSVFTEGKYDDIDDRILYNGSWVNEIVETAYGEALFISNMTGDTAAFTFVGTQFQIGYLEDPGLGIITVTIDGTDYTLDQSTGVEWSSPELTFGEHSILLTHESGDLIVLDYINILGSP